MHQIPEGRGISPFTLPVISTLFVFSLLLSVHSFWSSIVDYNILLTMCFFAVFVYV